MALSIPIITLMLIANIQIVECNSHGKIETAPAIIDGKLARKTEWPWIVSIMMQHKQQTFNCGGSLIHRYWVLTASHCLYSGDDGDLLPIESFKILIGAVDIEGGRQEGYETTAERYIQNPGFIMKAIKKKNNDIALIKLSNPVPDRFYHIIKIGRDNTPKNGDRCMAMGWGCDHTSATPVTTSRLYHVILPVLPVEKCSKKFTELVNGDPTTKICAGFFNRSMGICSGDSGGPLICRENRQWVLSGIISFTIPMCPAVFTRVSAYMDWIILVIQADNEQMRVTKQTNRRKRFLAQYLQSRLPTLINGYPYYNFILVRRPYPVFNVPMGI